MEDVLIFFFTVYVFFMTLAVSTLTSVNRFPRFFFVEKVAVPFENEENFQPLKVSN